MPDSSLTELANTCDELRTVARMLDGGSPAELEAARAVVRALLERLGGQ